MGDTMAHGTRINGTSYGITGGKCLVNGTAYSIQKGRTLIGGTGYDISFGTPLSAYFEGNIVRINENGSPLEFYIAKHNYESGLNGNGRTLVARKDCYENGMWDSGNVNAYASSDIDSWCNKTYKNLLDSNIQNLVGTTKFYYTPGNDNWNVETLNRSVFVLSCTELGQSSAYSNIEGSALPISEIIKIGYINGVPVPQWTRTPALYIGSAYLLNNTGQMAAVNCTRIYGLRPVFTLPSSTIVGEDGLIL